MEHLKNMGADAQTKEERLLAELSTLERMALVAGLPLAAQWIRDNAKHAVIWVEGGDGYPVSMMTWVAKERGLEPIRCAVCGHVATEIDNLYPWHKEHDRCAAHADLSAMYVSCQRNG